MKMRTVLALLVALLWSGYAWGAWSTADPDETPLVNESTVSTFDWTTKSHSGTLDVSACDETRVSFDPSTGDASTDASVQWRACDTDGQNIGSCVPIQWSSTGDGVLSKISTPKKYLQAEALTATAGGDTARARIQCLQLGEEGTATGGCVPIVGFFNPTEAEETDDYVSLVDRSISTDIDDVDDYFTNVDLIVSDLRVVVDDMPVGTPDFWTFTIVDDGTPTDVNCAYRNIGESCNEETAEIEAGSELVGLAESSGTPTTTGRLRYSFCVTPTE